MSNRKGDTDTMEAKATAKYVKMSPIKLKPVADLIRGKALGEARTILTFTPGKASEIIEKVLNSVASNAENNFDMNPDELYVSEIIINQGPTMKRWRAAARGSASPILKRSSHVTVKLKDKGEGQEG